MALRPEEGQVLTEGPPPPDGSRILVVTAVPAERDAVVRGLGATTAERPAENPEGPPRVPAGLRPHRRVCAPAGAHRPLTVDTVAAGVGPAAAAAATATLLTAGACTGTRYDLVVSAGIGGGFAHLGAHTGRVVIADAIVAADLGAQTPDGFAAVTDLGFGTVEHLPPPALVRAAAEAAGALCGTVLTVSTVTGTAERAAELTGRHPRAVAEAMEGFGVAEAAAAHGVPALEVRAVSNAVGPRDRAAWRIGDALDALAGAFPALAPVLAPWKGTRS